MRIFVEATWASVRLVTSRRLVAEGTKCGGHTHLAASFFDVNNRPVGICSGIQSGGRSPGDGERKERGDCQRASHLITG
jgi:hypothetical protein